MSKTISIQNLHRLIDTLITEGTRVVGPKEDGAMTLYAPLMMGEELALSRLPRRSAKEAFFPLCETILSYEKKDGKMAVQDVDPARFPETVLIGTRPCDAAAAPVLDAVFSWDYKDEFFLARREKTTVIGLACTTADDACFCTAVGLSPADARGSDLFLLPLEGNSYRCQAITDKGSRLLSRFPDAALRDVQGLVKLVDRAELAANDYSLTPGRYVGVAAEVEDDDFDFEEALREIHLELDGLNTEAAELAEVIGRNFEELLG